MSEGRSRRGADLARRRPRLPGGEKSAERAVCRLAVARPGLEDRRPGEHGQRARRETAVRTRPEAPAPRRGGARSAGAARPSRTADHAHGPPLLRHSGGRRGRLPARARDPAHQGADDERGRARAMAQDGGQARGVRDSSPARSRHAHLGRRGARGPERRRAAHRRARRGLRAAPARSRGPAAPEAPGGALPRPAGRGIQLQADLRGDRLDVYEG